jgi:hypothetical protein
MKIYQSNLDRSTDWKKNDIQRRKISRVLQRTIKDLNEHRETGRGMGAVRRRQEGALSSRILASEGGPWMGRPLISDA